MNEWMREWMDRWKEGRKDGRKEGWKEGWKEGKKIEFDWRRSGECRWNRKGVDRRVHSMDGQWMLCTACLYCCFGFWGSKVG
jgi:hypothetical protein